MEADDPKARVRALYRGIDGFEITREEERKVRKARSRATYGEIQPTATLRLLEALRLSRDDVFYDLGCGVGKVVMFAALATEAKRCVGIELASDRIGLARDVLRDARRRTWVRGRRVAFREEDILEADLRDATVLYTCSTAFPTPFMRKLMRKLAAGGRPVKLATLQVLDDHPAFTPTQVLRLDMTWRRRSKVYIYRVEPEANGRTG